MTSMGTVVEMTCVDERHASLAGSARANGQDQVGILIADHSVGVIWGVVGGSADRFAGRAVNGHAGWVAGIVLHGRDDLHASSSERVAIDVGKIIRDLAVSPGELELRDRSGLSIVWRELDREANILVAICLAVATFESFHGGV